MTLRRSPLGGGRLSSEYMHVIKMKQKAFPSKLLFSLVWMIALDAAARGGTTSVACMDAAELSLCLRLVCRLGRRPLVSFRLPEYLGGGVSNAGKGGFLLVARVEETSVSIVPLLQWLDWGASRRSWGTLG